MITKQERIKISELIEAKQVALSELNQADFASEIKTYAAFAYVRASDELEAYLDSMVASEDTTATNGGWIEWGGGQCPTGGEVVVRVRLRDARIIDYIASGLSWSHTGLCGDIVAYRIVSE